MQSLNIDKPRGLILGDITPKISPRIYTILEVFSRLINTKNYYILKFK